MSLPQATRLRPHLQPSQLPSLSPQVNLYVDYVKTVYRNSEVETDTGTVKWPPTPSKVYINLVHIDRSKSKGKISEYDEVTKAMVQHGDVDVVHAKKWPIDFDKIAAGVPSIGPRHVVLVEGAPGVGKSTFAWEFCRRWERGEIAQQYQLVLLLRLRDGQMSQAKALGDLIYHPFEVVQQAVVTHLGHSLGLNTLFVFEGFDELPDACRKDDSLFLQLIQGKILPHATVMVTSRPWALQFLVWKYTDRIFQHIEILGFTTKQISEYVTSVLSENDAKSLDTYIKHHPQLKGCMYIPLNTVIVVTVYQESQASGSPMPTTLTELYIAMSRVLLIRYLSSHPNMARSIMGSIAVFNDMPVPWIIQKYFTDLCKLAYNGIVKSNYNVQLIFGESDLPEDFDNLGFMDSVTELYVTRGTVSSHNFLHLTFQEFLAAVHISNLSPEEELTHFQRHSNDGRFTMVLRFLAGVSKLNTLVGNRVSLNQSPKYQIEGHLKCDGEVSVNHLNWMFEAQSDDAIASLIRAGLIQFRGSSWSAKLTDYYSLGYCIVHSKCSWVLDLSSIDDEEEARMLVAGAAVKHRSTTSASVVGLHTPSSTSCIATVVNGLNGVFNLEELSIIKPLGKLSNIQWPDSSSLKVLKLDYYTRESVETELEMILKRAVSLEVFHIHGRLSLKDSVAVGDFIETTITLTTLVLDDCSLEGIEVITKALLSNKSLERLILNDIHSLTGEAADFLAQFITVSNTLQHFGMDERTFKNCGLQVLAQLISCCNSKLHKKQRHSLIFKISSKDPAIASPNMMLYCDPVNRPSIEFVVLRGSTYRSEETLRVQFNDVHDLDKVLRAYPNMVQCICIWFFLLRVSGNDLLVLAQVLHNNPTLNVEDTLGVLINDERDIKGFDEALRIYPNIKTHVNFMFCSVNQSDLPVLAQVFASNNIKCDKMRLDVKINCRRDIKNFEEVLRTYPTVKQYNGSCLVSGRDLPSLAQVLHYNPVKMGLKVSIQDGGEIQRLDQVLRTYRNMEQYITCSIKSRYLLQLVQVLENSPKSLIHLQLSVMIQDGRDFKM